MWEELRHKRLDWNIEKNNWLQSERSVSFEQVKVALEEKGLIDAFPHPNQDTYPNQYLLLVEVEDYIHSVPCVIEDEIIFLKTIYKNRKAQKIYKPHYEE